MVLRTERLYIRELLASDWEQMGRVFADFEQSAYAVYDMPLPVEDEAVRELTARFAETGMFFGVFLPEAMEIIGYVCFHVVGDKYDLGYCFRTDFHRRGYAFEAVSAMMGYMEERGASVFTAGTALDNTPSCGLLKKLGFVLVSTETLAFRKDAQGREIAFVGGNFVRDVSVSCTEAVGNGY